MNTPTKQVLDCNTFTEVGEKGMRSRTQDRQLRASRVRKPYPWNFRWNTRSLSPHVFHQSTTRVFRWRN